MLRRMLVIVLAALIVSACCSSRETVRESSTLAAAYEKVDSVKEQVVVAERDTVMVTKTITITKNEAGDTTFTSVVTEKERFRDRSRHDVATYRTEVRVDTVYIERRDSVGVKTTNFTNDTNKPSGFVSGLKWVFWIIIGLIGLGVVIKWRSR